MEHTLLAVEVRKELQGTAVLNQITLSLTGGRIYGFVGANGSGKTMLFRALSGLIEVNSGTICLDGVSLQGDNTGRPKIGLMIENASLYPQLTGFQNLKYLAQIRGIATDLQIREALSSVGLQPDDRRIFRKYSLGMKQRLLLAQAVMEEPDFLFLDEPTNALDGEGVELARRLIGRAAERGAVVLLASHNPEDIETLCDEIYEMRNGCITGQRKTQKIDRQGNSV